MNTDTASPAGVDTIYRLLVQGVTDYAIYMLDCSGTISSWNAGAERFKGYKAEEIIGRHFSEFYTAPDVESGLPQRALELASTKGHFEGEGWRVRKDGTCFWANVVIDPVYDDARMLIGFAKITRDMTERRATERAVLEQERAFRLLVQGVTDYAIYMLDPSGIVTNWNIGAQRAKGYHATEIVGSHFSRFYTEEDRARGLPDHALNTALSTGKFEGEGWRLRKDGSRFWAHVLIDPIFNEDQELIGYAKITRDMTAQKLQRQELEQTKTNLDLALNNMSQGLCLFDASERLVLSNPRLLAMLDIPKDRLKPGATYREMLRVFYHDGESPSETSIGAVIEESRRQHLEALSNTKGTISRELLRGHKIFSIQHRGLPGGGWVSTIDDITERRIIEDKITYLAHHDILTGLPNRVEFCRSFETELHKSGLSSKPALLYIDLDRFKPVNDTLGHPAGDEVLRVVAKRMQAQARKSDVVGRLGGDEFAILVASCADANDAASFAERVIHEINRPILINGLSIDIGASVGIALAGSLDESVDMLLRNADLALYRAKQSGRGCARRYEHGMELVVRQRRDLERDLRTALAENQFTLHYQPVVDATRNSITSFEALIRWKSPTRGSVAPIDFIPFAEEIGLMVEIGDWVLRTACQEAATWAPSLRVSVNLSTTQFRAPNLVRWVAETLRETGLDPSRLELEVTETAMIDDITGAARILHEIRDLGVQIAIDDFGTGYSSLSFLSSLPFDRIKIDRSFVQDLGSKPKAAAIIRAVAGLCERLGVAATAEGVETEEQLQLLCADGCIEIQGYLVSRPCPAGELQNWIKDFSNSRVAA